MKVIINKDAIKPQYFMIVLVVFLISFGGFVFYLNKYSKFVPVEATYKNTIVKYGTSSSDNMNRNYYEQYEYNYDNNKYLSEVLVLFKSSKDIDSKSIIKINPDRPREIKQDLYLVGLGAGILLSFLGIIFFVKGFIDKRRLEKYDSFK